MAAEVVSRWPGGDPPYSTPQSKRSGNRDVGLMHVACCADYPTSLCDLLMRINVAIVLLIDAVGIF